jgi:hypothetical protein
VSLNGVTMKLLGHWAKEHILQGRPWVADHYFSDKFHAPLITVMV